MRFLSGLSGGGTLPRVAAMFGVLVAALPSTLAQEPGKGSRAGQTKDAPKSAPAASGDESTTLQFEPLIWSEPRREALLKNSFTELTGPPLNAEQHNQILAMARGEVAPDTTLIKRYVDFNAAELTRHANLAAMMASEDSDARRARALDDAAGRLMKPFSYPASSTNQAFRRIYLNQLKVVAKPLLEGHLHSRTFFMVVLTRADAPELIPILNAAIADPDQALSVKLLAAAGLVSISRGGQRTLDANNESLPASEALAGFLQDNYDAPWPIKTRCLEALGVLRRSSADPASQKAEFADVAFEILADQAADPLVRAWAGWSLSRMTYPGLGGSLNLELIAYLLAQTAVSAGEKVGTVPIPTARPTMNLKLAARWSEPLVRALDAFSGETELRGSGLNSMAGSAANLRAIEQRVRALTQASLQFSISAGNQVPESKKAVVAATQELKSYLQANPPKSLLLYRGGPEAKLVVKEPSAAKEKAAPESKKRP